MSSQQSQREIGSRGRLREFLRAPRLPVDLGALDWNDIFPGVHIHVLEVVSGVPKRALIRFDAGATVPEHSHDVAEDVLVMEGALELIGAGEGVYPAQTIFRSHPRTTHSARNVGTGHCLCYVVWPNLGD